MTDPIRVLFVCSANTCRSPFMELYARSLVGDTVQVASAGTHGLDGQPMSPEMVVELEARGLAADGFRSRPLTADLVAESDLVVTAERSHRRHVLEAHPEASGRVLTLGQACRGVDEPADDVGDPYRRGSAAATAAAAQITAMLDQFVPVLLLPASAERRPLHG